MFSTGNSNTGNTKQYERVWEQCANKCPRAFSSIHTQKHIQIHSHSDSNQRHTDRQTDKLNTFSMYQVQRNVNHFHISQITITISTTSAKCNEMHLISICFGALSGLVHVAWCNWIYQCWNSLFIHWWDFH